MDVATRFRGSLGWYMTLEALKYQIEEMEEKA